MLVRPSKPPTEAVTMVLSACRREVELASALVSSSKFEGFIWIDSFQAKPDTDPVASEAKPVFVWPVIAAGMPGNVKRKCHNLSM